MSQLHLRQPWYTYNGYSAFTKLGERIQKFKETGDLNHIYKNKLDRVCFALDVAYTKDLAKRTISDSFFKDRTYENAINYKYVEY